MLTADDIIAFAKRQGFNLEPGGCAKPTNPGDYCACIRRTLANEVTESGYMYDKEIVELIHQKFGLTEYDQAALEEGFEGWPNSTYKDNKYHKLGKKLAKLLSQRE